jgi:hypothetical protein
VRRRRLGEARALPGPARGRPRPGGGRSASIIEPRSRGAQDCGSGARSIPRRGMRALRGRLVRRNRCKRTASASRSQRTPGDVAGRLPRGDYRLQAALSGYFPARDERGMKGRRRSFTPSTATKMPVCRDFTGATGLEPATSGVTGRSWRLRAERGRSREDPAGPAPSLVVSWSPAQGAAPVTLSPLTATG